MKKFMIFIIISMILSECSAQKVIDIWNGDAPYDNGDKAELTIFLPKSDIATGRAVIICPGGGYSHLSFEVEGTDWGEFFTEQGIAAFILKYRLPKGNPLVPISDAEEAIKIVRKNAKEWNIKEDQVGIMGSSAGGHLASTLATHSIGDAKPNFQILFFPVIMMEHPSKTTVKSPRNLLGPDPSEELLKEYSNDLKVTKDTPRVIIFLCNDDNVVSPKHGITYYTQCKLNGVPASLNIYPKGGHGWGCKSSFPYITQILLELKTWLKSF
jgi:acetyl esterase/lipase